MSQTTTLERVNSHMAQQKPLSDYVRSMVAKTLTGKKADEFVTSIINLVNQNPDLESCNRLSLVASALQAQALNLSLNASLGQAYVVPYGKKNEKNKKATFQIGYKGYIQLAIRSGQYRKLNVLSIKEGELKNFDPLNEDLEVELIQDEAARAAAPTIGYYAMFEYLNGFSKAIYWTKVKMEAHAKKYSRSYANDLQYGGNSSFWSQDFDAMAQKTMLRQIISKWGIMSTDLISAMETDMKVAQGINDFSEIVDSETVKETGEIIEAQAEPASPQAQKSSADKARAAAAMKRNTETPENVALSPGDIPCPKPNSDGSQRIVEAGDCENCPDRPGCPTHE